jgi:hypothetical protein
VGLQNEKYHTSGPSGWREVHLFCVRTNNLVNGSFKNARNVPRDVMVALRSKDKVARSPDMNLNPGLQNVH